MRHLDVSSSVTSLLPMPDHRPNKGKSNQVVRTPLTVLGAIENHFGPFRYDLAALKENALCSEYFGPDHVDPDRRDALLAPWPNDGLIFINPPFSMAAQFTEKAAREVENGARAVLLLPASVGATWWRESVHGKAFEWIVGRIKFVGHPHPMMRDLACLHYGGKHVAPGRSYLDLKPRKRGSLHV